MGVGYGTSGRLIGALCPGWLQLPVIIVYCAIEVVLLPPLVAQVGTYVDMQQVAVFSEYMFDARMNALVNYPIVALRIITERCIKN